MTDALVLLLSLFVVVVSSFIISAKWTKWMAEIMRSFDVCVFVGLCVCVCSGRSWELNANSSKTVKAKFDTRVHRHSPDMTPKNFPKRRRGHGHVTPYIFGR